MTETESAILAHARRCAPAESCGFVVRTPEPGMRQLQKRRQNHQKRAQPRAPAAQLPRQRRQQIPRRRQKRQRRTPGLLKRQRDRAPR
ncbi:Mov34/MPN/PAD-1 family protein, partial [Escherichia coli]|nr:Mov34/MPN/PAD-1 family protein [Escherichia coli]MCA7845673.1 Mov34/MPN/PAD-1 family protein [Escherichia coli]